MALILITRVVSPIASAIYWWGLSSSKTVSGGVFASRHGRFRGGALATTDFGANEVLTRVKLLPRKLVTICFTLPVRTATAAQ